MPVFLQGGATNLRLYFNELSLDGQFQTIDDFQTSIETMMLMRSTARRYGREVFARRSFGARLAIQNQTLIQTLSQLSGEKKTALSQWLYRSGPFWDDEDRHDGSTYFARQEEVVTDTSVGEVAWRQLLSEDARLLSLSPSGWSEPVVNIDHHLDSKTIEPVQIQNYCSEPPLETALKDVPASIRTWRDMGQAAELRFAHLSFSEDWINPLIPTPFIVSSCDRFLRLLEVLNLLKESIETSKVGDEQANSILAKYFTGDRAWFSDSSNTEINKYRSKMTFPLPGTPGETLFCPFHGKVSTGVLRLHFSWPVQKDSPLYIVYAGPKLTK